MKPSKADLRRISYAMREAAKGRLNSGFCPITPEDLEKWGKEMYRLEELEFQMLGKVAKSNTFKTKYHPLGFGEHVIDGEGRKMLTISPQCLFRAERLFIETREPEKLQIENIWVGVMPSFSPDNPVDVRPFTVQGTNEDGEPVFGERIPPRTAEVGNLIYLGLVNRSDTPVKMSATVFGTSPDT